jgi:L-ascorbate metabolism protein UlaG (beta-lactamase superfamily)
VKKVFLVISILFCNLLLATENSLKIRWFGTTCFAISDSKSTLFFDPYLSRPSFWDLIFFKGLVVNENEVLYWLKKIDSPIKGLFVSHTHFDHVLDLGFVAKNTNAPIFGSLSAHRVASQYNLEQSKMNIIRDNSMVEIGDFKVTALKGKHPPHLFGSTFATGQINEPLVSPASFYYYKMDQVYSFYIEHPMGRILFHPSGHLSIDQSFFKKRQVDLLILGMANRQTTKELWDGLIGPSGALKVIPGHHDQLLSPLRSGFRPEYFVDVAGFKEGLKKINSEVKIKGLSYGAPYLLRND